MVIIGRVTFAVADGEGGQRHFMAFFIETKPEQSDSGACAVFTDVAEYVGVSGRA